MTSSSLAARPSWRAQAAATFASAERPREERMTGVLDDYLVDPRISLLDKTRIQAQVLVPVLRALRAELGKDKADAIVKQALCDWASQLFAAIGEGIEGSPRRTWAPLHGAWNAVSAREDKVANRR